MGTLVSAGSGRGIVIGTGMNCELGRVFDLMTEQEERKSPLQVAVAYRNTPVVSFFFALFCLAVSVP